MKRTGHALFMTSLLLAGCHGPDGSRPPSIRYGEESCAHCRMIISDERFASALARKDGEVLKFDDVGCMVLHEREANAPAVSRWVRDYTSDGWLPGHDAIFVYSREIASPMGHGLAAVSGPEHAATLGKAPGSRRLKYEELAEFVTNARVADPGRGGNGESPRAPDFSS